MKRRNQPYYKLRPFTDSTKIMTGSNGARRRITFTQIQTRGANSLALVNDNLAQLSGFKDRTELLTRLGYQMYLSEEVYFNAKELKFYLLKDITPVCLS